MVNTNILITSAGKRVELLKEFKKELSNLVTDGEVLTVDLNPLMAPACHYSDKSFSIDSVLSANYTSALLDICKNNNVGIVVPTIDTELHILSQNRNIFAKSGIEIMISDESFIQICRDKRLTNKFFSKHGIKVPNPIDKNNPTFPIFAKPYDGSLSKNIHIIRNHGELTQEILSDPKLMFMELIDKHQYKEFTIDMYYGNDGNLKSIVPRERIEIRSGEVNKGATRKNGLVSFLKNRMGYVQGVRGCICVQLFYREADNDIYGIEINPRFGGGYPLSYHAGANFPEMMIKEYILGEDLKYTESWNPNTIMLRYDSQVIFKEQ